MQDVRIAMIQMTCRVADLDGNLTTMARFTRSAAEQEVDIICFRSSVYAAITSAIHRRPNPNRSTEIRFTG